MAFTNGQSSSPSPQPKAGIATLVGAVPVWLLLCAALATCGDWPFAWTASKPTPTSEIPVITRTDTVALCRDFGGLTGLA